MPCMPASSTMTRTASRVTTPASSMATSCVFDGNILVRETNNGDATQRVVALNRRNKDRLAKGAVVAVVGRLGHRDERVGLADFLRRCEGGSLTEAEQATLQELAARAGEENRALNEIQVRELAYM